MPMNRVQFQKGLSLPEFMNRYGTEELCEQALVAARWPGGFVCPACGVMQSRTSFRREGRLYWQCAGCQYQCSVTSGTVFEATKLPLTRWFLAMQLLTQAKNNVSALELTRQLGVSYRTAWLVKHKLLQAMALAESERQLTGRVEVDDAYLGGERSGGKTGRGSENKVPFVVAVQTTEDGRAHLACLSARPFTKAAMQDFIATSMGLPLTVVSDGLGCFTVAASMGAVHDREVTGGGKASVLTQRRIPCRQHAHRQHQDGADGHVPRRQVREVRLPLPRRGPVPLQPALRHAGHAWQPAAGDCSNPNAA